MIFEWNLVEFNCSSWLYLDGFIFAIGGNWCRNIVDFMVKWLISGFKVPTGSAKISNVIARVELYILPKFDPNRSVFYSHLIKHIKLQGFVNFQAKLWTGSLLSKIHGNSLLSLCILHAERLFQLLTILSYVKRHELDKTISFTFTVADYLS